MPTEEQLPVGPSEQPTLSGAPASRAGRRAFLLAGASSLALPLTALASAPLLAQVLGAQGRGEMTAALAPPVLGVTLVTLGLPDALTYFTARHQRPESHTRLAVLLTLATGVVTGVATWFLAPLLLRNFPDQVDLLRAIAPTIPLALLAGVGRGLAQGLEHFRLLNNERWLAPTLRLAALLICAWYGVLTVESAVWITWGMGLLSTACYLVPLSRVLFRRSPGRSAVRPFMRYSVLIWAGSLAGLLVLRVDQVLLTFFSAAVPVGWYAAAVAMGEVPQSIINALRPMLLARGATETHALSAARLCRLALTGCAAMAVIGSALAPLLVPRFFGDDFTGAVPATQILLFAALPASVSIFAGTGLSAMGRPGPVISAQVLALAVTLAVLPFLAPRYGATGAALTSLAAYSVAAVYVVMRLRTSSGLSYSALLVVTKDDVAALMRRRASADRVDE